jgi:hypothetical protein
MIDDGINTVPTASLDEGFLARRGLVKVAAAASVATGLGTLWAAKPALADERGHQNNVRHHSHTDRNGLTRTFVVFHDLDDNTLKLAHRRLEDPVDEYGFVPLESTGGPFDDLSIMGDDEGRAHVAFLNRTDGNIYHHEIFPDDLSRNRRHNITGHLRAR